MHKFNRDPAIDGHTSLSHVMAAAGAGGSGG